MKTDIQFLNSPVLGGHHINVSWPRISVKTPEAVQAFLNVPQPKGVKLLLEFMELQGRMAPRHVTEAIRSYTNCQLPLLAFAGANQSLFLYTYSQSPALCYELACRRWTDPSFDVNRDLKQREWWENLHNQSSRSFSRQMAKIPAELLTPGLIKMLSTRWANSKAFQRKICHIPRITKSVVCCLLVIHEDALLPNLLTLASEDINNTGDIFSKIQNLWSYWQMRCPDLKFPYSNLTSQVQLIKAVDRLGNIIAEDDFFYEETFQSMFPDPPLRGTDLICPIRHPKKLSDLAARYSNCARRYVHRVYRGYAYLYEVRSRNIVILTEKVWDRWLVTTVERSDNCPASKEDRAFVNAWYEEVVQ